MSLLAPVSWGELFDKITILQIKSERITDPGKLHNVRSELDLLLAVRDGQQVSFPNGFDELVASLRLVNERIWDTEDAIRFRERENDFGPDFVELARAAYQNNDRRAELKYRINVLLGSQVVEEKSYQAYESDV